MLRSNIKNGNDLMLFCETSGGQYEALAFATSHSFSIQPNTSEVMTKDTGLYSMDTVTSIGWEITTENLYVESDFKKLLNAVNNQTELKIVFGGGEKSTKKTPSDDISKEDGKWAPDNTKKLFSGNVIVTSLEMSASAGEHATYSATFKGQGSIDMVDKEEIKTT